jgi:hypothetical protein
VPNNNNNNNNTLNTIYVGELGGNTIQPLKIKKKSKIIPVTGRGDP